MRRCSCLTLDSEGFAFDPGTGDSFLMNQTGLAILEGFREGKDDGVIASMLSEDYELALSEAERDVADFHSRLKTFGLG